MTGGASELAFSMWADGVPGGHPLACARPRRSTQAAADGGSPPHPAAPARDPLAGPLAGPPLDVRERTRHRDNAAALLVWGCGGTAGGPDVAARHKALVDGEEDDEVLGTSNPGDCPYDPDDCPSIEVVESETGWRRRPCVRRRPPHGLSGRGFEDDRVRPRGGVAFQWRRSRRVRLSVRQQAQNALFRHVAAPGRCGATPPPGCGALWRMPQLGKCARATPRQAAGWVARGFAGLGLEFGLTERCTLPNRWAAECAFPSRRDRRMCFSVRRRLQSALFRRAAPRLPR